MKRGRKMLPLSTTLSKSLIQKLDYSGSLSGTSTEVFSINRVFTKNLRSSSACSAKVKMRLKLCFVTIAFDFRGMLTSHFNLKDLHKSGPWTCYQPPKAYIYHLLFCVSLKKPKKIDSRKWIQNYCSRLRLG